MPTGALGSYGLAGWGMGVGMGAMDSLPTSYLLVAVSLDGKVMGVRFTEAEDGGGLNAQPIAGNANALATMPMPLDVMIVDATSQLRLISGPGQVSFRYS
jgi:hypothetical protein